MIELSDNDLKNDGLEVICQWILKNPNLRNLHLCQDFTFTNEGLAQFVINMQQSNSITDIEIEMIDHIRKTSPEIEELKYAILQVKFFFPKL